MEECNKEIIDQNKKNEIFEKYIRFDENKAKQLGVPQEIINDVKDNIAEVLIDLDNDRFCPCPKDFIVTVLMGMYYACYDEKQDENINLLSKVIAFLKSNGLCSSTNHKITENEFYQEKENEYFKNNYKSIIYSCLRYANIEEIIRLSFPYLYKTHEIQKLKEEISAYIEEELDYDILMNILADFFCDFENRVIKEYGNLRTFYRENKNTDDCLFKGSKTIYYDFSKNIAYYYKLIKLCSFIHKNYHKEYEEWKVSSNTFKFITSISNKKYYYFYQIYNILDGHYLYNFFETLNGPHAFDKDQFDYIREMAPKLRISSYLNEEYAKYKKWYNPAARDFDFGEDEPGEEATVISKDHLERLSHFKEEKLTNLLDKLKENQYIEKDTRPKDWLFAFGMSGDEKPEYFKKIQWIGRSNRGISPTYFTDFIGILGYDLKKIYFEESKITISILNSCFMTTDKPIDQNSFNRDKGEFKPTVKHKKMAKLVKECGLLIE